MEITRAKRNNKVLIGMACLSSLFLSICISLTARFETGSPPGLPLDPLDYLVGQPAPLIEVVGLDNTPLRVDEARERLLLFANSKCTACDGLYPKLSAVPDKNALLIIGTGDKGELQQKLAGTGLTAQVGYDSLFSSIRLYKVSIVPSAVLIDEQGIIRSAASGRPKVEALINDLWDQEG